MRMIISLLTLLLLAGGSTAVRAQTAPLPAADAPGWVSAKSGGSSAPRGRLTAPPPFSALLAEMNMVWNRPLDSDYRTIRTPKNDYLADHFGMYSRDERLEIRFHLIPEDSTDRYFQLPHLRAMTLVMNLTSNADDVPESSSSVISFGDEELEIFGADWAKLFTFRPKRSYSEKRHAQLVATYKEGSGMAYAVLLFDKAPETLEGRQLALRFR